MMELPKSNYKTRNLTFYELFITLQEEYILCEIRSQIYPVQVITSAGDTVRHQEYWQEVMQKKRDKILDMAQRNTLSCIFDDKKIKDGFKSRILPSVGYPKFTYRDAHQQLFLEKWDLHNYYSISSTVDVIDDDGKTLIGTIVCVDLSNRVADIKVGDSVRTFSLDTVTRKLDI